MTQVSDDINDDVFQYPDSNESQCISKFGRNFVDDLKDWLDDWHEMNSNDRADARDSIKWNVGELVRWCRHFNRKSQEQARTIAILEGQLAMAEDTARQSRQEADAPAVIRRALDACETCRGLPDMSMNRCAVCRVLQEGL